jgi:hypothetical protein
MILSNQDITKFNNLDFTKTFFVILLGITGNYLGETFSCQTKQLLNHMLARDVLLFVILYFAVDLFDSDNNLHPIIRGRDAFIIWIFYNMFTKMTIGPTLFVFGLLCATYVLGDLIAYNKDLSKKDLSKKDDVYILQLEKIKKIMMYGIATVTIIGFIMYYFKQKKDHAKKFSNYLFFRGVEKCSHQ